MDIKDITNLTENELDILEALWREDRPLTRSDILEAIPNRKFKDNSFYSHLNTLLDNGTVGVGEIVKTGKTFGRTYIANIKKDEFDLMKLESTIKQVRPSEKTVFNFLTNMFQSEKLNKKDLDFLEKLIENKIKKDR